MIFNWLNILTLPRKPFIKVYCYVFLSKCILIKNIYFFLCVFSFPKFYFEPSQLWQTMYLKSTSTQKVAHFSVHFLQRETEKEKEKEKERERKRETDVW
jgi:hypothetical protein